jgi:nitrate reductase beta subunit
MYRLLAIAKYEDRYVIPKAHVESARDLDDFACSLDADGGPGMGGARSTGDIRSTARIPGTPIDATVESFHSLKNLTDPSEPSTAGRLNLLNWSGKGITNGMFPPPAETGGTA